MNTPHSPSNPLPEALRRDLARLYEELDADVRTLGVGCWIRGECCNFERQEHVLYASTVEIAYARDEHPELAGPTPLPESKLCPFWKEGRCTEREHRPLGCRVFHCDRRYDEALSTLYERYHKRVARLAEQHGHTWEYVPFVQTLRAGTAASSTPAEAIADVERP